MSINQNLIELKNNFDTLKLGHLATKKVSQQFPPFLTVAEKYSPRAFPLKF